MTSDLVTVNILQFWNANYARTWPWSLKH